jgi:aminomethyltransferase
MTPLNSWHRRQGAKMESFAGYDMPLWYSSAKNEHLAVLTDAGMFDTSHMAAVTVTGSEASDLLQHCFTNDLNACLGPSRKPLPPGRCVYGAFLDERGHTIDDAIVFFVAAGSFVVVVNAGMGRTVADHLKRNLGGRDAAVTDLTDRLGKIDLQGPAAAKILSRVLIDPERVFSGMPYFSFKGHFQSGSPLADTVRLSDGTPILLSRTGYTGEFGFEIFLASDKLATVWERLLDAGRPFNIRSCGLAARDSLRVGAMLPLSHQDIGDWPFINHPWPFALPFTAEQTGFTKDFIGATALQKAIDPSFTQAFVGQDPRKVTAGSGSRVVGEDGCGIGTVLTCATDMGIGFHEGEIVSVTSPNRPKNVQVRGLCCGFLHVTHKMAYGRQVDIADERRKITVTIVKDIRPHRTARAPMKDMV